MLVESVKAMNAKSDPSEEERKGGSGHVGKAVMSVQEANNECDNLCIVTYVPDSENCNAKEWLTSILKLCGCGSVQPREDSNAGYAMVCVKNDPSNNVFCLKFRDMVIQHANGYLRQNGLIPEHEEEDEDEMVFGDD